MQVRHETVLLLPVAAAAAAYVASLASPFFWSNLFEWDLTI